VSGTPTGDVRAEPNLTPLLDVVFQLITFFMLVINFSKDTYDQRVHLPVAGSARPVEKTPAEDRLVLNINSQGHLLFNGQDLTTEEAIKEIGVQAEIARFNLNSAGKKVQAGDELPATVAIRADRAVPFTLLYRIIQSCQANGYRKFALKAMNAPVEGSS